MAKKLFVVAAVVVVTGGLVLCARGENGQAAPPTQATFFVATNGNDSWSGKLAAPNAEKSDGPFATLSQARDAVRELRSKGGQQGPVKVLVRGGKYYLAETLSLGPKDSGSKGHPIIYAAYPGERPILSGGKRLRGWKPFRGKTLKHEEAETRAGVWKFRQLFLDGKPLIRARFPNFEPENPLYGGYLQAEGPGAEDSFTLLRYTKGTFPRRWAKPTQGEVFLWDPRGWGYTKTVPIRNFDSNGQIITLGHPVRNYNVSPWFWPTPVAEGEKFTSRTSSKSSTSPGSGAWTRRRGLSTYGPQ